MKKRSGKVKATVMAESHAHHGLQRNGITRDVGLYQIFTISRFSPCGCKGEFCECSMWSKYTSDLHQTLCLNMRTAMTPAAAVNRELLQYLGASTVIGYIAIIQLGQTVLQYHHFHIGCCRWARSRFGADCAHVYTHPCREMKRIALFINDRLLHNRSNTSICRAT